MRRASRAGLLGLLCACGAPAPAPAPHPAGFEPPEADAAGREWVVPEPGDARLAVVWAASREGRLEPFRWDDKAGGGIARHAAYLAWLRRRHPELPVLHLEGGNSADPDPARAEALFDAYRAMGLDGYNLGPLELAGGLDAVVARLAAARLPFLSSNLHIAGAPAIVPRSRLVRVAGAGGRSLRVLVLGVGGWGGRDALGMSFARWESPRAALERLLLGLAGTADYTVLLANGVEPRELACALEGLTGIDVVLTASGEADPLRQVARLCGHAVAFGGYGGFWIDDTRLAGSPGRIRLRHHQVGLDVAYPPVAVLELRIGALPPWRPERLLPELAAPAAPLRPAGDGPR